MVTITNLSNTTFLCDQQRSGRLPYGLGGLTTPELQWKFVLRSYPVKGPESMPVFDGDGNIYFGAHDGCFYSLTSTGELRWMFKTGEKIYSSPTLYNDELVIFASGTGHIFAFTLSGEMRWVYDTGSYFRQIKGRLSRKYQTLMTRLKSYDHDRKKYWSIKCWSSPGISADGVVYITGYGIGLHALQVETGELLWAYNLGGPRFHLSGVAQNTDGDIFVSSQRRMLHCLSPDGALKWRHDTRLEYDNWGSPSVDPENGTVFFPLTYREKQGVLHALDFDGNIKWVNPVDDGIRASASISRRDYIVYCGLGGTLYFASRHDGKILHQKKLCDVARALWTAPSIDAADNILLTTKDGSHEGSLVCLDADAELRWRESTGKALSIPVVDAEGKVYIGSWDGDFRCYQT